MNVLQFLIFLITIENFQERFRTITTAYYRGAMGIMLVYDITNEKSFDNIKNWIRNIEEHASADVEKMILGNKCDMNDRRQVIDRYEQIFVIEEWRGLKRINYRINCKFC